MSFLNFFIGEKKKTSSIAKERLQVILAYERSGRSAPNYLPALQRDLVAVISKYVKIDQNDIIVNLEQQDNLDVLEVKIELPENHVMQQPAATHRVPPRDIPQRLHQSQQHQPQQQLQQQRQSNLKN
ncbi:MAG: cell division topological specificity factor MinE [Actinomycetaceae bacterium]|nr:cell division topological specificity factor MinE [Actinomycetaceae bacterium]